MRGGARRRPEEEDGESAFISFTDMTVSFLFIVMIILAFFATQVGSQEDRVALSVFQEAKRERDDARRERDELKDERASLQAKIAQLEARVALLEVELEQFREEHAALRIQRDTLQANLLERDAALDAAERRLAESQRLIEGLEAEMTALEREVASLRARLEAQDPLEAYIAAANGQRRLLLETLAAQLRADFPDLEVEVSAQGDALNFRGDGIFDINAASIRRERRPVIDRVAERLDEVLPCYTLNEAGRLPGGCDREGVALIEAVQIEGHTDATGSRETNIRLSASRGAETYFVMTARAPSLLNRRNPDGQPVLSIAGYGPDRPVASNETNEGRRQNRRIDLRFIMLTPRSLSELDSLRVLLQSAIDEQAP